MTRIAKFLFVFTSYAPLWLLLGLRFRAVDQSQAEYSCTAEIGLFLYGCAVLAVPGFLMLFRRIRSGNPVRITVKGYTRKDDLILSYAITYFPPLLSFNLGTVNDLLSLIVLYVTVFVVYVQLDAFYINPFFALTGYRVFEFATTDGQTFAALVKRTVHLHEGRVLVGAYCDGVFFVEGARDG